MLHVNSTSLHIMYAPTADDTALHSDANESMKLTAVDSFTSVLKSGGAFKLSCHSFTSYPQTTSQ